MIGNHFSGMSFGIVMLSQRRLHRSAHTAVGHHAGGATEKRARGSCAPAPNDGALSGRHQITDAAVNNTSLPLNFDLPQSP